MILYRYGSGRSGRYKYFHKLIIITLYSFYLEVACPRDSRVRTQLIPRIVSCYLNLQVLPIPEAHDKKPDVALNLPLVSPYR